MFGGPFSLPGGLEGGVANVLRLTILEWCRPFREGRLVDTVWYGRFLLILTVTDWVHGFSVFFLPSEMDRWMICQVKLIYIRAGMVLARCRNPDLFVTVSPIPIPIPVFQGSNR